MRALVLLSFALVVALPASGQRLDIVTGFEGTDRFGYLFGTVSYAFPVSANVDLIPRATLSYLFYSYQSGQGNVSVRAPGAMAGVGVRFRAPNITLTVGPGIEGRQTMRRDAGIRTTSRRLGLHLSGNLWARPASGLTFTTTGRYSFVDDYGNAGATLMHTISPAGTATAMSAGVEGILMGNPEVHAYGGGGILGMNLGDTRTRAQFRLGYLIYVAGGTSEGEPYYGVGIVRAF